MDHDKTRRWDIKSRTWVPLAGAILGDRRALEGRAMPEAQRLVERAAGTGENRAAAQESAGGLIAEFYRAAGWQVSVRWK